MNPTEICTDGLANPGLTSQTLSYPAIPGRLYHWWVDAAFAAGPPQSCNQTVLCQSSCGVNTICGTVTALKGGARLSNVLVELHNEEGQVDGDPVRTDANGFYAFSRSVNNPYFVVPVVDRTQYAFPPTQAAKPYFPAAGAGPFDFKIGGVTGEVRVQNAEPGTLVYVTVTPLSGFTVPTISPEGNNDLVFSGTVGASRTLSLNVPSGFQYYLKCLVPTTNGERIRYTPTVSQNVGTPTPGSVTSQNCPSFP